MGFDDALNFVLRWEGGWSDDPRDPGGATMKGVTIGVYTSYCLNNGRPSPTKDNLKNISDNDLKAIYKNLYWNAANCDKMPDPMALLVFDSAVNMGVKRAILILQDALGLTTDGAFGPITQKAVTSQGGSEKSMIDFTSKRIMYYASRPNFNIYGLGWLRRANSALVTAAKW